MPPGSSPSWLAPSVWRKSSRARLARLPMPAGVLGPVVRSPGWKPRRARGPQQLAPRQRLLDDPGHWTAPIGTPHSVSAGGGRLGTALPEVQVSALDEDMVPPPVIGARFLRS